MAHHGHIERGQGVQTLTPEKNHKNIGFLSKAGPLKITKLPSLHSMLGHYQRANKTLAYNDIWIHSPHRLLNKRC